MPPSAALSLPLDAPDIIGFLGLRGGRFGGLSEGNPGVVLGGDLLGGSVGKPGTVFLGGFPLLCPVGGLGALNSLRAARLFLRLSLGIYHSYFPIILLKYFLYYPSTALGVPENSLSPDCGTGPVPMLPPPVPVTPRS
jgi:hypothetical protein